jgi:hypothetical protein
MLHMGRGSITVSVSVFEAVPQSRARHSVVEAEVHSKPAKHLVDILVGVTYWQMIYHNLFENTRVHEHCHEGTDISPLQTCIKINLSCAKDTELKKEQIKTLHCLVVLSICK